MKLIIGSHVSFTKEKQLVNCVEEELNYGGNALMLYTGAPQNTNRVKISNQQTIEALDLMKSNSISPEYVFVHAPYIINLANNREPEKYNFSISFLKQEIKRCQQLGVKKIIVHPGSHTGIGIAQGINNIINALNLVIEPSQDVAICIETMSGKGTECGYNFEQIKQIIDGVTYHNKVMVCLDTCHLHDAGYNLQAFDDIINQFNDIIGINKIGCVHINDSKNPNASKKDRHENIGFGTIGFNTLLNIIYHPKLEDVAKILETPYVSKDENNSYPPYKFEIEMIKNKQFNEHLKSNILAYYEKTN